jgi:hypothetical protein
MTPSEWLSGTDVTAMLDLLGERLDRRRRLLFAVAACRRLADQRKNERCTELLAEAERAADDPTRGDAVGLLATVAPLHPPDGTSSLHWEFEERMRRTDGTTPIAALLRAVLTPRRVRNRDPFLRALWDVQNEIARRKEGPKTFLSFDYARQKEQAQQANLLRDLFGHPVCPPTPDPAWLTWNNGTVPRLAAGLYDEGAFDRLPILADALEDAGCTDAAILDHCRGPGPHVRGCWVVDLLLGKE